MNRRISLKISVLPVGDLAGTLIFALPKQGSIVLIG
jgi:hypothetical protein